MTPRCGIYPFNVLNAVLTQKLSSGEHLKAKLIESYPISEDDINGLIDNLPEKQAKVLTIAFKNPSLTYVEVANLLGVSKQRVGEGIKTALRTLFEALALFVSLKHTNYNTIRDLSLDCFYFPTHSLKILNEQGLYKVKDLSSFNLESLSSSLQRRCDDLLIALQDCNCIEDIPVTVISNNRKLQDVLTYNKAKTVGQILGLKPKTNFLNFKSQFRQTALICTTEKTVLYRSIDKLLNGVVDIVMNEKFKQIQGV